MSTIVLEDIKRALVAAGIAGPHQSHSRHNNISKIRACIEGDPDGCFGISGVTLHAEEDVLGYLAELTGCSPDVADLSGVDTIDPDKTVKGIVDAAMRLRDAAERGATLLAVTGHPTGMLEHHIRVVDAFRAAGGKPVRLREEEVLSPTGKSRHEEVRYVGGVGCLADWGALKHTHSAHAMEALLEAEPWPEIVIGDHGFAGAAIERGIPTIAVMDINDPALAIAWADGSDVSIVPMDDNRPPRLYEPSWRLFEHILAGGEI
ncbi:MAG TPA: phosphatase [Actinomycetota bacterium]|nr:phosphatase [Actinomycetota bacterium]